MGPLDVLMHLGNLFLPAVALAVLTAALSFRRLALPAALACAAVTAAGLVVFGRDGKMATYAGMVLACAFTLWWRGFGPGRR